MSTLEREIERARPMPIPRAKLLRRLRLVEAVVGLVLVLAMAVMIFIALVRDLIKFLVTVALWVFENRRLVAGAVLAITAMLLVWTWKVSARGFEAVSRFSVQALEWSWAHRGLVAGVLVLICTTVLGILWARHGRAAGFFG